MRRILSFLVAAGAVALVAGCGESVAPAGAIASAGMTLNPGDMVTETQLYVHECDPSGTGGGLVGDKIADFAVLNCNGDAVALHDACGRRKALWLVGAAGWCTRCTAHMPDVVRISRERRADGLETYVFVSETERSEPVTAAWCHGYAARHNLDPARTLYVPDTADGLQSVWDYIRPNGGGGGTIALPWEAVLDPYSMTLAWETTRGGDVVDALDGLLD